MELLAILALAFIGLIGDTRSTRRKRRPKPDTEDYTQRILEAKRKSFGRKVRDLTEPNISSKKFTTQPQPDTDTPKLDSSNQWISAEEKATYLKSPAWKKLKQQRLSIANHKCEATSCNHTTKLQLHHETYIDLLHEDIDQLRILCKTCHSKLHRITRYSRADDHPITLLQKDT